MNFFKFSTVVTIISMIEARKIFSPIQDIILIDHTDNMARFDLHCSQSYEYCRFILLDTTNNNEIIHDIKLLPRQSYQRRVFKNLKPKNWYQIIKYVDNDDNDSPIESGQFRTKYSKPLKPEIDEIFCLNYNEILVRWSSSLSLIYEDLINSNDNNKIQYSYQIEWWPMNSGESHNKSLIIEIHRNQSYYLDQFAIVLHNFMSENHVENDYNLHIRTILADNDYNYTLKSMYSETYVFNCHIDTSSSWINSSTILESIVIIVAIMLIFSMIFATWFMVKRIFQWKSTLSIVNRSLSLPPQSKPGVDEGYSFDDIKNGNL